MRKNLFDILQNMELNVVREYTTLYDLFFIEKSVHSGRYLPIADVIDGRYFRSMSIRGTFTSIGSMMYALGLGEVSVKLDELFLLCEFLLSPV